MTFERLIALGVLGVGRRIICWMSVTSNPTAYWLARQITLAIPWDMGLPPFLIRDNDGTYGEIFTWRLHAMGIRDRPISP
jgi:hypothetical protein